ncbi:terpene synthase family protein [Micromonospora fluostatini]|uniref:terpene synthase family protein n=1 Tax=Micromonospora sp. JCM 30529 TaxID=3421643 RepID=UPI003D17A97C
MPATLPTSTEPSADPDATVRAALDAATEQGRICALAARGQRDLQTLVAEHPDLFPNPPVDPAMLGAVAMSTAFIAPWCTAAELRVANRASLWVTAEDWQVERGASAAAVDAIVTRCLAVADGSPPADGDQLGHLLARIRADLDAVAAFADHRERWREEVRRMLAADAREWRWRSDPGGPPTVEEYLDNADGFGATFVNVSHWIATGDAGTLARLDELTTASRQVQQIVRLVNDLASHDRDRATGDLNVLALGPNQADVRRLIGERLARCQRVLADLAGVCPRQAAYLSREIGFTTGFYRMTDFWGDGAGR